MNKDSDFLKYRSWYDEAYRFHQDSRWPTFKVALNLLYQLPEHRVLETGCVRMRDDWGGGMSTVLFGQFLARYGGHLVTVDNSDVNMQLCRELTAEYVDSITYVLDDSIAFLERLVDLSMQQKMVGETDDRHEFDLVYLDSLDCPVDGDASDAQRHQLSELMLALELVHDKSIVLLDDNGFANGGKTAMSNEYLLDSGWTCLMQHQQSLWILR